MANHWLIWAVVLHVVLAFVWLALVFRIALKPDRGMTLIVWLCITNLVCYFVGLLDVFAVMFLVIQGLRYGQY